MEVQRGGVPSTIGLIRFRMPDCDSERPKCIPDLGAFSDSLRALLQLSQADKWANHPQHLHSLSEKNLFSSYFLLFSPLLKLGLAWEGPEVYLSVDDPECNSRG